MNSIPHASTVGPDHKAWHWWLVLILIGVLALGVRLYYVMNAVVFQPVNLPKAHGDAVEYYNYARNLVSSGIFSRDPPGSLSPVSDSFRDPGYPVFLAAWMKLFPNWDRWYAALLFAQATLSALTVVLWLQVGRRSLSIAWLAAAGVVMAVWPHSVAMSSDIMSETLYGFLIALALAVFGMSERRGSVLAGVWAGFFLGLAALTNAVLIPFALLLPLYKVFRHHMRLKVATAIIAVALSLIVPWSVRNASVHAGRQSSSDRIKMNFVQGSWPSYHSAFIASEIHNNPEATVVVNKINNETYALEASPMAGLSMMYQRIAQHPGEYLKWYLEKPALLWGWRIRIGAGDIYFHVTYYSPYDVNKVWRIIAAVCHASNTLLMLLALAGCLHALLHKSLSNDLEATAWLLLIVTAIHSVLQAEPRYSIPYRGAEIMVAAMLLGLGARRVRDVRSRFNGTPLKLH